MSMAKGAALAAARRVASASGVWAAPAAQSQFARSKSAVPAAAEVDSEEPAVLERTRVADVLKDKGAKEDGSWLWCSTEDSVFDAVKSVRTLAPLCWPFLLVSPVGIAPPLPVQGLVLPPPVSDAVKSFHPLSHTTMRTPCVPSVAFRLCIAPLPRFSSQCGAVLWISPRLQMTSNNVGALLVLKGGAGSNLAGIITERGEALPLGLGTA